MWDTGIPAGVRGYTKCSGLLHQNFEIVFQGQPELHLGAEPSGTQI